MKDTIPKNKLTAYRYNYDFTAFDSLGIDTSLRRLQIYNPAFKNLAANTYLGNLCLPFVSVLQSDIVDFQDMLFTQYIRYNMHLPNDIMYYRTLQPFTALNYYSGGPKIRQTQKLNIIHTQNVNSSLNVGFLVDLNYADGQYLNQRGKSNALSLFSSYKRNRYSFNTNFNLNIIKNQENGGLVSDELYDIDSIESNLLPVKLMHANTIVKNQSFFINQCLFLTGSYKEDSTQKSSKWNEVISIIHQLKYDRNIRLFNDDLNLLRENEINKITIPLTDSAYFNGKPFIDNSKTRDSLYFRRLENIIQIAINTNEWLKFPAELRFGLKNQIDRYSYGMNTDSVYSNKNSGAKTPYIRTDSSHFNTAFVANLSNRFSKNVNWGASAELYFMGYKQGDLYLKSDFQSIIKSNFIVKASGQFATTKPGYFLNSYKSNNFEWNDKVKTQQQTYTIRGGLYQKKYKLSIEVQTSNYTNYVYFNVSQMPSQESSIFSVNSLTVSKLIDWRFFHSEIRASFQTTTNDSVISLPKFSGFNSTYFEVDLFKKVLKVQLGFDVYYNSVFYAMDYQPATGMFYNQRNSLSKAYPYADMFLNIKLKRARISIKYEHFNSLVQSSTGYFAPHYPIAPHLLNFGLSWTFYD